MLRNHFLLLGGGEYRGESAGLPRAVCEGWKEMQDDEEASAEALTDGYVRIDR